VNEVERIKAEYARRDRELPADRSWPTRPGDLFQLQVFERALLRMLRSRMPLSRLRILDLGCGGGRLLVDLETWGAQRERLAGIDLTPWRAEAARARLPGADIRTGDARELPWPDGSFDLVVQSVVFSSLLDPAMRTAVAAEVARALAPGGAVLSWDLVLPSPGNEHVTPIRRRELERMFPGWTMTSRRLTLAPPLTRFLAPRAWLLAELLEGVRVLDTHLIALLEKPPAS
jgi:SAM-dependent methyltransferase